MRAYGISDVVLQRGHNEDSFSVPRLPVHVADGMGGHRAGDVASKLATEAIGSFSKTATEDAIRRSTSIEPLDEENKLLTSVRIAKIGFSIKALVPAISEAWARPSWAPCFLTQRTGCS
jgi:serine/threonine protein phosphatase PrpC